MGRRWILTVAVVAMFVLTALSIPAFNEQSSDADSEKDSSYVYVSFKDLTKDKFESVFDPSGYTSLFKANEILSDIFGSDCISSSNAVYEYSYDRISVDYSKSDEMKITDRFTGQAQKVSVSNLTITITLTAAPSYVYATSSTVKDFTEIIQYLGEKPVGAGSKIVLRMQDYLISTSSRTTQEYTMVSGTGKYILSGMSGSNSDQRRYHCDVTFSGNDKSLGLDVDTKSIIDSSTDYTFSDPVTFKEGSIESYVSNIDYNINGYKVTANGRTYDATVVNLGTAMSVIFNGVTQTTLISPYLYVDLPTVSELKYNELFNKLQSFNSYAAEQIRFVGGTCDETKESSYKCTEEIYNECAGISDKSNSDNTVMIIFIVIMIAVIATASIVCILLFVRPGYLRRY